MDIINFFFKYIFCILDIILLDKLCSINFVCKRTPIVKASALLIASLCTMIISSTDSLIYYILIPCVLYLFVCFFYEDINRLYLVPFVFVFYIIYEFIMTISLSLISMINLNVFMIPTLMRGILFAILSRGCLYIGLSIYAKKRNNDNNTKIYESYYMIFFFLGCFLFIINLYDLVNRKGGDYYEIDITFIILSIFIMMACLFKLLNSYKKVKTENIEYKNKVDLYNIKQEYYVQCTKKDAEILKIRHDLKNYSISLRYLLEEGQVEKAKQFLEKLTSHSSLKKVEYSNNFIINAILNTKVAKYSDIKFDININIDNIIVSDIDLSILLGNSIDNAIEAVKKLNEKDRIISILIKQEKQFIYLKIVNPAENIYLNSKGILLSKKNTRFHNLGVNNMKETAEKYNGEVVYDFSEHIFTLEIYLYV